MPEPFPRVSKVSPEEREALQLAPMHRQGGKKRTGWEGPECGYRYQIANRGGSARADWATARSIGQLCGGLGLLLWMTGSH